MNLEHNASMHKERGQSKKHYVLLDGLRGIAALAILIFHYMEIIITDFSKNILAHGFLAVDFFFCLSGFVIAYAYDERIHKIGFLGFVKQRLKRLHPLVLLGTVLGLIAFMLDPFSDNASTYSLLELTLIFLCSALLLPYPSMEDRYFNNFGLNAPSWSLFWEYIASLAYASVLVKLPKKYLAVLAILAAIVLIYIVHNSGNLLGGWNGETFWHGGVRVLFSFVMGMCIYRFQWFIKNNMGFWGLSTLLFIAFLIPYDTARNWLIEPLLVIVYFPLIIALGAGSTLSKQHTKYSELAGKLSYPLYMTHYFIMWPFATYYNTHQPENLTLLGLVLSLIALQILIAYLSMRYYDTPIRRKITNC